MLDRIFDLVKIQNKISGLNEPLKKASYNYLINEFEILFSYHSKNIPIKGIFFYNKKNDYPTFLSIQSCN